MALPFFDSLFSSSWSIALNHNYWLPPLEPGMAYGFGAFLGELEPGMAKGFGELESGMANGFGALEPGMPV
jgi:hypothetical protein